MERTMEVREISESEYQALSSDGKTWYTIRFVERDPDGTGEDVLIWSCDCPAGRHGRTCKHISAVGDFAAQRAAELGYE